MDYLDAFGKRIEIGQYVVYSKSGELATGVVLEFRTSVRWKGTYHEQVQPHVIIQHECGKSDVQNLNCIAVVEKL